MTKNKKLLVMAGGTGGHIFPALAVAQYLKNKGWTIRWLGTQDRMEATLVPQHHIDIDFIKISGLRGKGIKPLLLAPFRIAKAVRQARKIIKTYQPDVVLGMGGYVSGPGGIAAYLCGVPIVLHEQNGVAGLTNRWLSKIAKVVLQAFPTAFPNAQVVGNPVRQDVVELPEPQARFIEHSGAVRILVMGGSQGAKAINDTLPDIAKQMQDSITIWHQVGKGNVAAVSEQYGDRASYHKITEFIGNISEAYAWADIIICRSGALTVSEIETVGLGAIFIPFMHKDKQQYWNAKPLEAAGAAKIIEQPELNSQRIIDILATLERKELLEMAIKARSIATRDSVKKVAEAIENIKINK